MVANVSGKHGWTRAGAGSGTGNGGEVDLTDDQLRVLARRIAVAVESSRAPPAASTKKKAPAKAPKKKKAPAKATPDSTGSPSPVPGRRSIGRAPGPECKLWGDALADAPEVPGGVDRKDARATYHYYAPGYETSTLACADRFWADPGYGHKLLKYPWTAYCLDGRSFSQGTCGRCLRVTNRRTGAWVIARAVDNGGCSDSDGTGLDLDPCAFRAIDTDGRGHADGFVRVDVREVECGADGAFR